MFFLKLWAIVLAIQRRKVWIVRHKLAIAKKNLNYEILAIARYKLSILRRKVQIVRLWVPSFTWHNAATGATQVFFASFSPTQLSFLRPAPRCLNSKCICADLCTHVNLVWKRGVFRSIVGVLLFWGSWNRLHHWPTKTWSKVNGTVFIYFLLFKECVSNMRL